MDTVEPPVPSLMADVEWVLKYLLTDCELCANTKRSGNGIRHLRIACGAEERLDLLFYLGGNIEQPEANPITLPHYTFSLRAASTLALELSPLIKIPWTKASKVK